MVGTGRFELPTCRLGGGRSIHLSYVPIPIYILILNHFEFQPILPIIFSASAVSKLVPVRWLLQSYWQAAHNQ